MIEILIYLLKLSEFYLSNPGLSEVLQTMEPSKPISRPLNKTVPCPELDIFILKAIITSRTIVRNNLSEAKEVLPKLVEESKLMTTFLYKNHNRFRNDKGYKLTRMVEKSVQKVLKFPLVPLAEDLLQFIPDSPHQMDIHLPTVAMCQFLLLQLMNAAEILQKIEILCKNSGLLSIQRLNLGHFWGVAAVNLAVLGRIWVLCRNLLSQIWIMYSNLTKISKNLPGEAIENLRLPEDLNKFVTQDLSKLLQNNAGNNDETGAVITVDDFLDIGTPVKRKAEIVVTAKKPKIESVSPEEAPMKDDTQKKDVLGEIHSLNDLKAFIEKETEVRKTAKKTSFTRKLNQEQWKALKKEVLKSWNPSLPNKSIKLCRKIIRNALK